MIVSSAIDKRLGVLEMQAEARRAGDPVADWLKAYRAGASVEERNRIAGPAWVLAAEERHRLADQTMVDYGDENN